MKHFIYTTLVLVGLFTQSAFPVRASVGSTFTASFTTTGVVDSIAPSTPASVVATPVSQSQINLSWAPSTDNVGVAGYVVFRDSFAVATTTSASFIDIGLFASTTYTYEVQAFDTSFNYSGLSTPAATTTLDVPVVVVATSTPVIVPSSSSNQSFIFGLKVSAHVSDADISFGTIAPARSTISWGLTSDLEAGSITSILYSTLHEVTIPNLVPNTHYFARIAVVDVHGNQFSSIVEFTTHTYMIAPLVNPSNFSAQFAQIGSNGVNLTWTNPNDARFDSVRIVRGENFFPRDQFDGVLVYEGGRESFFDTAAVAGKTYYYTIFAKDVDGAYSSGALAQASSVVGVNPFVTAPQAGYVDPLIARLTIADFEFIQQGKDLIVNGTSTVMINGISNLTIRLPYNKVPEVLKTIAVSLTDPRDSSKAFIFLLRANSDKTFYEASIGALNAAGSFPLAISILDYQNQSLKQIAGSVQALVYAAPAPSKDTAQLLFLIILVALITLAIYMIRARRTSATAKMTGAAFILVLMLGSFGMFFAPQAHAAINQQINYQGKLTNASNIAVADGSYTASFSLYTVPTGGAAIWTELDNGSNKVVVKNGLFSVMLGSTTPFTGVDFNQTLYLGVTIEADSEMTPRKVIGTVPSAIVAQTLQNITPGQLLRSDIQNSTSTSSTFLNVLQSGAGKIAEFFGQSSFSVFSLLSNGNVGVGTSTPGSRFAIAGAAGATTALFSVSTSTSGFATTTTFQIDQNGSLALRNGATLTLNNLNGPLQANNGVVSATSSVGVLYGGTGVTTAPSYGNILVGNNTGGYVLTATSSLGLPTFSSLAAAYPFTPTTNFGVTNQATTGIAWFQNGVNASSTSRFVAANFSGNVGIGNSNPTYPLTVTGKLFSSTGYILGSDMSLLPVAAGQSAVSTWWGMQLVGNKQSAVDYSPANIGSVDDFSVIIPNQQASKVGLIVQGAGSQTGNLQVWRDSGLVTLANITSAGGAYFAGNVGVGTTSPFTALSVMGSGYFANNVKASYFTATSSTPSVFPVLRDGEIANKHSDGSWTYTIATTATNVGRGTALLSAISQAQNGDTFYLASTTYDIGTSGIDLTLGGTGAISLYGSGKYNTVITSATTSAGAISYVILAGSNTVVSDLSVLSTGTSNFAAPYAIFNSASNVVLQNAYMTGGTDGIYFKNQSSTYIDVNATIRNVTVVTQWDAFMAWLINSGTINIYDSTFTTDGTSSVGGNLDSRAIVFFNSKTGATLNVYNTYALATNPNSVANSHDYSIYAVSAVNQSPVMNIYGGVASTTSSAVSTNDLFQSGAIVLNVTSNTVYSPSRSTGTITYVDNPQIRYSLGSSGANSTVLMNSNGVATWTATSSLGLVSGAAGLTGQIQFNNSGAFAGDSSLFWDNTNKRLGISSSTPSAALSVSGTASLGRNTVYLENTSGGGGGTTLYVTNNSGNAGVLASFVNVGSGPAATFSGGNVGIGTTSPYARLSVAGRGIFNQDVRADYFTATSTSVASSFLYASTTALTVGGNLYVGSLNGPLQANNGAVSATTSVGVLYGGTGLTTAPTYGQVLVGNALGGYTLTATSSLGISGGTGVSGGTAGMLTSWTGGSTLTATGTPTAAAYFASSTTATSTFMGGLVAGTNGLTVLQNGNVGVGTASPSQRLVVESNDTSNNGTLLINNTAATTYTGIFNAFAPNLGNGSYGQFRIGKSANNNESAEFNFIYDTGGNSTMSMGIYGSSAQLNIKNNGYVGIGTQAPTSALHLFSVNPKLTLENDGADGVDSISFVDDFSEKGSITADAGNSVFNISSNYPINLLSNGAGFVGIGTAAPAYALDVNGFVNVNGTSGYKQDGTTILVASSTTLSVLLGGNAGAALTDPNGLSNTAIGFNTLSVATSSVENTAVGYNALANNGTNYNTAVGTWSMYANTYGIDNTAIGGYSLRSNTTGSSSAAGGTSALQGNTTGSYNTGFGKSSLRFNSTGSNNTALGFRSLFNALGSGNVGIGFSAGKYETGSDSFYLDNQDRINTAGDKAGALLYGKFNATAANQTLVINASTTVAQSLSVLGSGASYFLGNLGLGTSSPFTKFAVMGDGYYAGNVKASNFTATSSTASTFPYASSTALTVGGNLYVGSLNGLLLATNGTVSAVSTSSLNLSIPLASTTGTLGVANGGTGATTYGQGWIYSVGGTGALSASTSPTVAFLYATSTTATSTFLGGLNVAGTAGLTVLQNGNVGIGTTSPSATLYVNGTFVASSTSAAIIGNGSTGSIRLGDGTITKATGSGYGFDSNLTVAGGNASTFSLLATGAGSVSNNAFSQNGSGSTGIYFPGSSSLGFSTNGFEAMRILSSGNIGVGTTSASGKLSVAGTAGSSNPLFILSTTTAGFATTTAVLVDQNGNLSLLNGSKLTLNTSYNGPLQANNGVVSATSSVGVLYGGTGLATAPTYGQVLVGNALGGYTLTATSSLGISGGTGVAGGTAGMLTVWTGASTLTATGTPTAAAYYASSTTATSTFRGGLSVAGSAGLTVLQNGNVGIGTGAPTTALTINHAVNETTTFLNTAIGNTSVMSFGYNGTSGQVTWNARPDFPLIIQDSATGDGKLGIHLDAATTYPLSNLDVGGNAAIGSYAGTNAAPTNGLIVSGDVGVGTASPSYKLHVAGTFGVQATAGGSTTDSPSSDSFITTYPNITANSVTGDYGGFSFTFYDDGSGNLLDTGDNHQIGTIDYTTGAVATGDFNADTIDQINYTYAGVTALVTDSSGKVGIGTLSPLSSLDVVGNAAIGSYAGTNAAPSNGLIVSGNVGIGTASPEQSLHVKGAVVIEGNPTPRLYFKSNDGNWFVINRYSGQESYSGYFGENSDTGDLFFRGQGSFYFGDQSTPAILANGATKKATFVFASSTAFSTAYASSTRDFVGTLNLPNITGTQCLHSVSGVVSGTGSDCTSAAYPFTSLTNYGATNQATTGITWFQNGLNASSTSHFANASTTVLSATAICISTDCRSAWPTGGGSLSSWSTTTSTVAGRAINYSNNTTDIVAIGGTATTTAKYWFDPNALTSFFTGNVGIGTTSPFTTFSVMGNGYFAGNATASNFTATSSIASTFPYASTTALTVDGNLYVGSLNGLLLGTNGTVSAVSTSSLNLSIPLASTTGTLSVANGGTGLSSTPTYGQILVGNNAGGYTLSATSTLKIAVADLIGTTDNLTQGTNNLYYSNTLVNTFVNGSTTIPKTYTANTYTALQTLNGGLTIGSLNGPLQANNGVVSATSSVGVLYGGTGLTSAPSYGQVLVGNATGGYTLTATSSLGFPIAAAYPFTSLTNYGATNQATTGIAWFQNGVNASSTSNFVTINASTLNLVNALTVANGGTGASAFGQGWIYSTGGTGALAASTSPTVAYIYASSTTATSTFMGGVQIGGTSGSSDAGMQFGPDENAWTVGYKFSDASFRFSSSTSLGTNDVFVINKSGNVGIGTSSPFAKLSVVGQTVSSYFTATTSTASTFPYASTTALTVGGNLYVGSLNGLLLATNGTVSAVSTSSLNLSIPLASTTGTLGVANGGTGLSSTPTYGQILVGNNAGGYTLTATSSLGLAAYPFTSLTNYGATNQATTGIAWFQNGVNASSTSHFQYASSTAETIAGNLYIASLNGPLQANNGAVSATSSVGVLYGGTGLTSAPSYGQVLVGNALGGYTLTATSSLGITSGSSGAAYPFTPLTNYSATNQATTGIAWFQNGLNASSTSHFQYASTTALSADVLCIGSDCRSAWPTGGGSGGGSWSTTTSQVAGRVINYSNNTTDIVAIGGTATTTAKYWFDPNALTSFFTGNVGIGTTSPFTALAVMGNGYFAGNITASTFIATSTTATSTFAGSFSAANGAFTTNYDSGITSIASLQTGSMSFDTDAGVISWVDLPISGTPGAGTVESYSAQIGTSPVLTVYGEANGSGGSQNLRVGIGTTSPFAKLSVAGDGYFVGSLTASSTGTDTGLNLIGSVNSFFQGNIQNTSSGSSASSDWVATANNGTASTHYIDMGINGSAGGATPFTTANNAYLYSIDDTLNIGALGSAANIQFYTTGGLTPVERMRIDNNGNVGIGSTSPFGKFAVDTGVTSNNSAVNVAGSINDFLQYDIKNMSTGAGAQAGYSATADTGTPTSVFGWMGINNSNFYNPTAYNVGGPLDVSFLGTGNDMYVTNGTANKKLYFMTGGTATTTNIRMTIDSSGRVGLGTTSPNALLAIAGQSGSTGQIFDIASSTGASYFHVMSTGAVGIGTSSPYARLAIEMGTTFPYNFLVNNQGSSSPAFVISNVNGNGNVGIGTSTPWAKLSLIGDASPAPIFSISSSTNALDSIMTIRGSGLVGATSTIGFFTSTTTGMFAGQGMGQPSALKNMIIVGNGKVQAGMAIVNGGLCVDQDGWCMASTTGRITARTSQLGGADVAEMYTSADDLQPGEIVSINFGTSVSRASKNVGQALMGIVSTNPGLILGLQPDESEHDAGHYPIALNGRVPVKVSNENGPIAVGDPITISSTSGVGMRAAGSSSKVVAIALEPMNDASGTILGFVQNYEHDDRFATLSVDTSGTLKTVGDVCAYGTQCLSASLNHINDQLSALSVNASSTNTNTDMLSQLAVLQARIDSLASTTVSIADFASTTSRLETLSTSTLAMIASTTANTIASSTTFVQSVALAVYDLMQASGQVIGSAGEWTVNQITATLGTFQKVVAGRVETQTAAVSNGLEMKSPDGQTWCVRIDNYGTFQRTQGTCDAAPVAASSAPYIPPTTTTTSTESATSTTTTTDTATSTSSVTTATENATSTSTVPATDNTTTTTAGTDTTTSNVSGTIDTTTTGTPTETVPAPVSSTGDTSASATI